MQGRTIEPAIFQQGVQQFAERVDVKLEEESNTAYVATFPDGHMARISNDAIGLSINYSSMVAVIHEVSLARVFLQENWLGVEGSPFYFSVRVEQTQALLFLETSYFPPPNISANAIADLLGGWEIYWPIAKQSLKKVNQGLTKLV
jgi:hypothetical protein